MRTIAHLSDLHFGTEDPRMVEALLADLMEFQPSLVAISGDITQRAKIREFTAARSFLDRIPFAHLVVPGNHDVPLYNLADRFFRPLDAYKQYISPEVNPVFEDQEIMVAGVNTARSAALAGGRISLSQIRMIGDSFCSRPPQMFKVLVSHHPFLPPESKPFAALVGRVQLALKELEKCKVDLILAGHYHLHYTADLRMHHTTIQRSILVTQAGTALSRRLRGEPNSYNRITIDLPDLSVQIRIWDGNRYVDHHRNRFTKKDDEWHPCS
jgi:3',5'-cyclic AMP phosphodiesterase CpdA